LQKNQLGEIKAKNSEQLMKMGHDKMAENMASSNRHQMT
jgi:hypothetical protein